MSFFCYIYNIWTRQLLNTNISTYLTYIYHKSLNNSLFKKESLNPSIIFSLHPFIYHTLRWRGGLWSSSTQPADKVGMSILAERLHSMFQCPHESEQDEHSGPDQQTQQPANLQWPSPSCPKGKKHNAAFHWALFVVFHINWWCKLIATPTVTEMLLKRDLLLYLKLLNLKFLCFLQFQYKSNTHFVRPTATPPGNSSSGLHGFLGLRDKMRQILTHTSVSTVHRRLEFWARRRANSNIAQLTALCAGHRQAPCSGMFISACVSYAGASLQWGFAASDIRICRTFRLTLWGTDESLLAE